MTTVSNSALDAWQYRITRDKRSAGRPVGQAWLEVGPGLDIVDLHASDGTKLGLVLGFPVDLEGQGGCLRGGEHTLKTPLLETDDAMARAVFKEIGGRCLLILVQDGLPKVYADCAAQIPCVYDTQTGAIGSTAYALLEPDTYDARFDEARFQRLGVSHKGWVPGGLTAHRGIRRVLPNHSVDMETLQATRYWPTGPIGISDTPEADVGALVASVRVQLEALLKQEDRGVAMALTAGRETRMLLGCAKPYLDQILFTTMEAGKTDCVMAARIAKDQSLNHRFLTLQHATQAESDLYLRRNGNCVYDGNADMHPSVRPIAEGYDFVGGLGGEVGRGFFWLAGEDANTAMTGAKLMSRFGLPADEDVIAALDEWLAALPTAHGLEVLDLAYLEHRMGPWSSVMFPSDPTLRRMAPIFTADNVARMLRLPPDWKQQNGLSRETVRQTWPELAAYPYNSLGPVRDVMAKVGQVLRDPSAIMRRLRKRRR